MKLFFHTQQCPAFFAYKALCNHFSSRTLCIFLSLFLASFPLGGCATVKEAVTSYTLMESLDAEKYTIYDTSGQFTSEQVLSAYKIICDDLSAEFYELPSVEQADRAFENNRLLFRSNVPALVTAATPLTPGQTAASIENMPYSEDTASGSNFDRYCLVTEDAYYAVSRIDNTLVYISTDRRNLKESNNLLRELGYY